MLRFPAIAPRRDQGPERPGSPGPFERIPPGVLLALALAVALVLAGVVVLAELKDRPFDDLTGDLLDIANRDTDDVLPRYTGLLTNLGVVVLAIAAGSALVGALVLRPNAEPSRFLGAGATLTLVALFDDFFLVHEWLASRDFPDLVSFAILALLAAAFLCRWRELVLRRTFVPLLVAAAVLLSLSVAMDADVLPDEIILEDGLKFAGIVAWSAWLVAASAALLGAGVEAGGDPARTPGPP